jgi:hypothetical protein
MRTIVDTLFLFLLLRKGILSPAHGTEIGGPTPTHRNDVTLVLEWDGKNITGLINPGPESVKLNEGNVRNRATIPRTGRFTFEADAKVHDGKPCALR